jgi:hypothetical protein
MLQQTTRHLMMVRPANFGFNEETAANNAFQSRDGLMTATQMQEQAIVEFDRFVATLRAAGVDVLVVQDTVAPVKPDAIFPNNWVTLHADGTVITYPMFAPTRRLERSETIIRTIAEAGFKTNGIRKHLEQYESEDRFLEGTGSIIFDHPNRLAYACLSQRTDAGLLDELCQIIGYQAVVFHSVDANGQDIYHTNVMMALGESFVVICMDSIRDASERDLLLARFAATDKAVIDISLEQMNEFAGNMLQVRGSDDSRHLVMSSRAYASLTPFQIQTLAQHTHLLHSDLRTIENYGGGSARCMLAEIFLPRV